MTVIYIGESYHDRTAQNNLGVRTYTRAFLLQTTSKSDGPYAVGSDPNLPVVGSVHPEDFAAWCRQINVENDNPWAGWKVTCHYDSANELNPNPVFEPAQISWDFEQFQIVALTDRSGDGITNSAGDIYTDPPPMRDDSRPIVTVIKNVAAVPTYVLTYQDATNSSAFVVDGVSVAAGKAKMNRISVSAKQERNGYQFRTLTFEIHLQRDGWALSMLDYGYRSKSGSNRNLITNTDGTQPPKPVLLDGAGAVLSNPSSSNAVYLSYNVYYQADFNLLPLS